MDQPTNEHTPAIRPTTLSLLTLAAPIIGTMISRTVMSMADFVMVSQLGTQAQAAITPAGVLLFTFIAFGIGVSELVSTFVSQSLGRGDHRACGAYAWQGAYLAVIIGLVLMPMWVIIPVFFGLAGHEPAVRDMEVTYARIGLLGIAPTIAAFALSNFFNGVHKPMVGFVTALIANAANIALNYVLIFGTLGIKPMGIAGAAWGTNIAVCLHAAMLLIWMLGPTFNTRFFTRTTWRLDIAKVRKLIWYGSPAGFGFFIDIGSFAIFTQFLVGRFGTAQLAANNICFRLLELSFMPAIGISVAAMAVVGKCIGQQRRDWARLAVRRAVTINLCYMGTLACFYIFAGRPLASLFTDDPLVIDWADRMLVLCAVFQLFDAMGITFSHALRGAGDTHFPAWFAAVMSVTLVVGGGFAVVALMPQLQAIGPWIAAATYIAVLGVVFGLRWRMGKWEKIDLFREKQSAVEQA